MENEVYELQWRTGIHATMKNVHTCYHGEWGMCVTIEKGHRHYHGEWGISAIMENEAYELQWRTGYMLPWRTGQTCYHGERGIHAAMKNAVYTFVDCLSGDIHCQYVIMY